MTYRARFIFSGPTSYYDFIAFLCSLNYSNHKIEIIPMKNSLIVETYFCDMKEQLNFLEATGRSIVILFLTANI